MYRCPRCKSKRIKKEVGTVVDFSDPNTDRLEGNKWSCRNCGKSVIFRLNQTFRLKKWKKTRLEHGLELVDDFYSDHENIINPIFFSLITLGASAIIIWVLHSL